MKDVAFVAIVGFGAIAVLYLVLGLLLSPRKEK